MSYIYIYIRCKLASVGRRSDLISSQFGWYRVGPAPTLTAPTSPNPKDPGNPPNVLYPPPHSSGGELDTPQTLEAELNSTQSPRDETGTLQSSDLEARPQIIGGFIIPYDQCWTWLHRTYNISLSPDHSQDLTVTMRLEMALNELGYNWEIEFAQHHDDDNHDLMLVTQRIHGRFRNLGPEGEEEVLQDDLKDILKPGIEEDVARKVLLQYFRGWLLR